MKAITLTQPWATLVAIGAKRIETRSWGTAYRGPLAIHAGKGRSKEAIRLFFQEPFNSVLRAAGYSTYSALPLGCIVATCDLLGVERMHHLNKILGWERYATDGQQIRFPLDQQERCFGHYADGRKAWLLHHIYRLLQPIPARGALGLWEWEPPFSIS